MIVYLSLLVALVGLVMYFIAANPKVARCGEMMFFAGLLAFLMRGDAVINLLAGK